MSNFAAFMTPLVYLFIFDLQSVSATSVRHGSKEGKLLRDFRQSCRRFFGSQDVVLEENLRRLADMWLAFTSDKDDEGRVRDSALDGLVEEALPLHRTMSKRLMLLHAESTGMPETAKAVFLAAGDVLDLRLPHHLRAAATAAEKAQSHVLEGAYKRQRLEAPGVGGRTGGGPALASDTFHCKACKKDFPKSDKGHRTSAEHLEAAKKRSNQ
jgi:hypothetical protein